MINRDLTCLIRAVGSRIHLVNQNTYKESPHEDLSGLKGIYGKIVELV